MKKPDKRALPRKLAIRREAIAELTRSQLPSAIGGVDDCSQCTGCCPDWDPFGVAKPARK
jgi:hypothetical protein